MLKQFIIRLDPEHIRQLKITAAKERTSMQKLIEEALDNYGKTKFKKKFIWIRLKNQNQQQKEGNTYDIHTAIRQGELSHPTHPSEWGVSYGTYDVRSIIALRSVDIISSITFVARITWSNTKCNINELHIARNLNNINKNTCIYL